MAKENNNTTTISQSSTNQETSSWPSVNTSTSESMTRLQISKSEEFVTIIKNHPKGE